ncbi:hypothetical protein V495_03256 [Pseudogymnoascus sp. VKM F-4514 (FW-929)]|nr:hypothetical protein V495_03256 [Pseudogymnoascus sp. VKM F-4514 (FW-929)]KFY57125.1 hypothetical protein V497_05733 [Pseudogymnoascus sp. VKM F-4516 (FW-969)]
MANSRIFTRVYSPRSAGELVSGKGQEASFPYTPLLGTTLEEEFRNHAKIWNRNPTALVSFSDRIVDTVQRAFKTHYAFEKGHEKHVSKKDITIAFIAVPPDTRRIYHSAKELAEACKEHLGKNYDLLDPRIYSHEFVFEWAIPDNYPVHKVSLQTLVDRGIQGIQGHNFLQMSTKDERSYIAGNFQQQDPWDIGSTLGVFAQKFGVRAPIDWISHQLFKDCVKAKFENIKRQDIVRLYYRHGHTDIVDFQFVCDLEDGINTTLYDWFSLAFVEFMDWRDRTEDMMNWEQFDCWETWYDIDDDGLRTVLSAKEKVLYERAKDELLAKHEKMRADIEAEAVRIGL